MYIKKHTRAHRTLEKDEIGKDYSLKVSDTPYFINPSLLCEKYEPSLFG